MVFHHHTREKTLFAFELSPYVFEFENLLFSSCMLCIPDCQVHIETYFLWFCFIKQNWNRARAFSHTRLLCVCWVIIIWKRLEYSTVWFPWKFRLRLARNHKNGKFFRWNFQCHLHCFTSLHTVSAVWQKSFHLPAIDCQEKQKINAFFFLTKCYFRFVHKGLWWQNIFQCYGCEAW